MNFRIPFQFVNYYRLLQGDTFLVYSGGGEGKGKGQISDVGQAESQQAPFYVFNQQPHPLPPPLHKLLMSQYRIMDNTTWLLLTRYKVVVLMMCWVCTLCNSFCNALYGEG